MRALGVLMVLIWSCPASAQQGSYDPDEGTLSSIRPRIPEPMVFDLVRPLGAEKGELEVNSLFRFMPSDEPRRLEWAPEVEYTFADGYGIEFELPLENAGINSFKAAIQGTLPGPWARSFIHGWQALGETAREGNESQINLLYLAGARLDRNWSVFSMTGISRERIDDVQALAYIANYSLFYRVTDSVSGGFETNFKGKGALERGAMLMPQIHVRKNRVNVQFGMGWAKRGALDGLQIGWRISREF